MKRRILRVLALAALLALVVGAVPGFAASGKVKFHMFTLWEKNVHTIGAELENWPSGAELKKVTSSNKSVIKATISDKSTGRINLKAGKAGKAKITAKYKLNGKSYSVSATYTVKKYANPIKTLKINGKKVNLSANKYKYDIKSYKKSSMTLTFTLSSGWKKLRSFYQCYGKDAVDIKSGKKFDVVKGESAYINLLMENKKGDKFFYHVNLI